MLTNRRMPNDAGEWANIDTTPYVVWAFKILGTKAGEQLHKAGQVIMAGSIVTETSTRTYNDTQSEPVPPDRPGRRDRDVAVAGQGRGPVRPRTRPALAETPDEARPSALLQRRYKGRMNITKGATMATTRTCMDAAAEARIAAAAAGHVLAGFDVTEDDREMLRAHSRGEITIEQIIAEAKAAND